MEEELIEGWIKAQSRETAILVALRTSLRVFPVWGASLRKGWARKGDLTSLPILRLLLISVVAREQPTREIKLAASSAAKSRSAFTAAFSASDGKAFAAADSANDVAASATQTDYPYARSIGAINNALVAAGRDRQALLAEIANDVKTLELGLSLSDAPLWSDAVPQPLLDAELITKEVIATETGSEVSFWQRWWCAVKTGEPLDLVLARDVALIPDNVWRAGPKAVIATIAQIEARYRGKVRAKIETFVHDNPYALLVGFDPATRRLVARPAEACDLSDIIDRIRRALRDYSTACRKAGGTNKLGEEMARVSKPAIDRLRADLRRYADRPLDLYDEVEAASKQLLMDASASGLHKEANLLRLVDALRNRASEVAASSPLVVETLRRRAEVDLARLKSSVLADAIVYCRDMKADSAGRFEVLSGIAIAALLDPKTPEVEKQAAYYFVKAMVPRGALVMAKARDEEPEPKKSSRGKKVIEIAGNIDKLDKAVDALQENIPEAGEWVTRLFTEFQSGNFFGLGG